VSGDDRSQIGPAALPGVRQPDRHQGAGGGPTKQHPKGDVVLWLCPPCALELTDPDLHQFTEKGAPG
jgi:hypothetical protein